MFENSIVVSETVETNMQSHEGKGRTSVLVAIDSESMKIISMTVTLPVTLLYMDRGAFQGSQTEPALDSHDLHQISCEPKCHRFRLL